MRKKEIVAVVMALTCIVSGCGANQDVAVVQQKETEKVTEVEQSEIDEQTQTDSSGVSEPEEESAKSEKPQLNVNLIENSDFSAGSEGYYTYTDGGSAELCVNQEQELQCDISSVGKVAHGAQVYYDGFAMKQGVEYEISFDVHSTIERNIDWRIQMNGGDYHAYANGAVAVTSETQHVTERFTMEEASDPAPRLCFNMGYHDTMKEAGIDPKDIETHSVILDNISIMAVNTDGMVEDAAGIEIPEIRVSQAGYGKNSTKIAVFADLDDKDTTYTIVDVESGKEVFNGSISYKVNNDSSGEIDSVADFTDFAEEGTYKIVSSMGEESYPFAIGDNLYDNAFADIVKMFYLQRCGQELDQDCAGDFAHPSCHDTDALVYGTDQRIDVSGGWHDAGDYGRYVVPGAKAAADLMMAYERYPDAFSDEMGIPESGNGICDILDEVRYELDWMLKMQDTASGGVYHKVTCRQFPGVVLPQDETEELVVAPISNTATGDFAAVMAMASRIYRDVDSDFADRCRKASEKAFAYLKEHSAEPGFKNPEEIVTGEYDDETCTDELFWAASELYNITGNQTYAEEARKAFDTMRACGSFGWGDVSGYGTYAVLFKMDSSDFVKTVKDAFLKEADSAVAICEKNPYMINRENEYEWGSNMGIANTGMMLLIANEVSPKAEYAEYAKHQLDYLFGVNATGYCFVTGEGTLSPTHTHHRPSQALEKTMPGMLVGGVNSGLDDPYAAAVLADAPPAKCYADNSQSYSCNEIAIYWNSPLVYLRAAGR